MTQQKNTSAASKAQHNRAARVATQTKTTKARKIDPVASMDEPSAAVANMCQYLMFGAPTFIPAKPSEPRRGWGPSIMQE